MKRSTPGRQDTKLRHGGVALLLIFFNWQCAFGSTPDCSYQLTLMSDPEFPEYEPGVPLAIEIIPASGDWPTTPALFLWRYDNGIETVTIRSESPKQEFSFPPPDLPQISMMIGARGPNAVLGCPDWSQITYIYIKRKGYVETTPTPTPIPTPCPDVCRNKQVYPPHWAADMPLDFVAVCTADTAFLGVETIVGDQVGKLEKLDDTRYRMSGLLPNRDYLMYFYCGLDCHGESEVRLHGFTTGVRPYAGAAWQITGTDGASSATLSLVGAEYPTPTTQLSPQATGDCIEQTEAEARQ